MVEDAVRLNLQRNERDDITLVAIWLIREEILGETETENNAKQIELKKELLSTWKKEPKKQKRQIKEQKKT